MRILIVENVTTMEKGGASMEEAIEAYGMAAEDDFDVVLGLDEDGEVQVLKDNPVDNVSAESIMK